MNRRALVIGAALGAPAPGEGPPREELDAARVAEMLRGYCFEVEVLCGPDATRAGIFSGYRRLIARVKPGDVAVVGFFGHGGMAIPPPELAGERAQPRRFQFIVPTDYGQTTEDDFRGISAWELSQLLRELTDRTENVTVILDCCNASQMSREQAQAGGVMRTRPKLTWLGITKHFDQMRERFGPIDAPGPIGNPKAVRLTAAGDWQPAVQTVDAEGRPTGALTQALLAVLDEIGDAPVSWRTLGDAVRTRVLRSFSMQRPMVEGPVKRRLFSLAEVDTASTPIERRGDALRLGVGRLAGVSIGDVYGLTRVGAAALTSETEIARVRVEHAEALHAIARPIEGAPGGAAIPPEAIAWPIELALARRAVWIDAPEPERAELEAAVAGSARLRVGTPPRRRVVGELRARGGELSVLGPDGRPIEPGPRPWTLPDAIRQLEQLAAAQALIELEGEHGLADEEVEVEWGTVHPGGVRIPRPAHGAGLGLGDRIYLRVRSRAEGQQRFAHVFNVGLCGKIKLLSGYAPAGIRLGPGREELVGIGPDPASPANGYGLGWPAGARRDEPGVDTLIVIVTTKAAELRALETADAGARAKAWAAGSPLQRLLSQLHDGRPRSAAPAEPFFVARRSYVLYPLLAPIARPGFAVDEDPLAMIGGVRADAWLGAPAEEREIEIRQRGLSARRPTLLDALVCTRGRDPARVLEARTLEIAAGGPARDGDLLWRGPVRDLVDIYLWSAPARGGPGLADLLERVRARPQLAEAAITLAVRDERAPWSLAGGASAALARAAGELLCEAAPETAGLLHTSFAASEGYGLGQHPASGLYRGDGVELGLSISAVAAG
ncbi:MAG TPA: caspase family protein [Kofleriaceae bacterium]|nr:caspase family protein [Kofleriaceae bacterium]